MPDTSNWNRCILQYYKWLSGNLSINRMLKFSRASDLYSSRYLTIKF